MLIDILAHISLGLFSILPGNYSGITHLEGNQYAIVDDKDNTDGFKILTLDIDTKSGKLLNARMDEPQGMAARRASGSGEYRDCEGVAYVPSSNTVFVSGEQDQQIMEYTIDGVPTGRKLDIPQIANRKSITTNLGFEALTYNAKQGRFWTTTESTLPADGEQSSATNKAVTNRLRFMSFNNDLRLESMYAYAMDKPLIKKKSKHYAHGVPSLIALDDGRLLVLERELGVKKTYIGSKSIMKLYLVTPANTPKIYERTNIASLPEDEFLQKKLIAQFTTRLRIGKMNYGNFEGMCLGPKLDDGRQTIILVSDSQNGAGNKIYHLKDYIKLIIL